ncbi:MAG TPA: recombinase family protein [Methylocystis sp.]
MSKPALRCVIYTRVSSDQGLEQDFNSLDAQREAAEAYIKSQAHEGWKLIRDHYDDGGYSGGTMERPALQRLLEVVGAGRIDIVVVYKVDRLTRSLADFAKLVELFDAHKVSFVSVTQSFNATTSMGRLTLNVLLSFAQFEREVTDERIRDKIAASQKKGLWMGGVVPLGYRVDDRKLVVDEEEAKLVGKIFERYLELGSIPALQRELRGEAVVTRERRLANGKIVGAVALTNGALSYILKNRHYLGELNHHGRSWPAEHEPIVDVGLFDSVQARLADNLNRAANRKAKSGALLMGKIFDDRGNPMSPSHAVKKGARYRYYVSSPIAQGRKDEAGSIARVPAEPIEQLVLSETRRKGGDRRQTALSDRDFIAAEFDRFCRNFSLLMERAATLNRFTPPAHRIAALGAICPSLATGPCGSCA